MSSMGGDLPPTTVFVDTHKNCMEESDLIVEDDDMLDPALEEEAVAATFHRQAPRVTKSNDDCLDFMMARPPARRPNPSMFLNREQTTLCPGNEYNLSNVNLRPPIPMGNSGTSTTGFHSQAASCSLASSSIPSTHLHVQYMESKRRLSRSMRQTELTRRALRRKQLRMSSGTAGGAENSRSYHHNSLRATTSTSMYSLPNEMLHSGGTWLPAPVPQMQSGPPEPTAEMEVSTREHIFQWASTNAPANGMLNGHP